MRRLILCLLLLVLPPALQAQYQDEAIRLDVPAGFQGPEVLTPSAGFRIVNFVRPIADSERGTLLQITTIDAAAAGLTLPDPGDVHPTEPLLDEFLGGVERRRQRFEVVSRERVELSGVPAARAAWRGIANGREMHGVLYCAVVGSRVVTLHTQTFGDAPEDDLPAAVRAIESATLQR